MKSFNYSLIVILFLGMLTASAQDSSLEKIAILPFTSIGVDELSIQTTESILRQEVSKITLRELINEKRTKEIVKDENCYDPDCAIEAGKQLGAAQVISLKLSVLGEKIIVQYFLVDVNLNKTIIMDQVTSSSIEDLETVMKRIASSIIKEESIKKNAEVGMIMESESEESLRRTSRKNVGVSFGYLYPQDGYDNDLERSFVFDVHLDYELPDYAVGMLLGIRKGFAMNIYGQYLFTKTDICPFVGGAFGFHWVSSHNNYYNYNTYNGYGINIAEKKTDGFELTLNTGVRLLHTYNFQILLKLEFIYTLNDYNDKAIVFTVGIL